MKAKHFERLIPLRFETPHTTGLWFLFFYGGKINGEDPQKIGEECKSTI